jgi:NAD(P)-dependent dehydrogenase (short-subunit alcohol dehydrogenase family)
MPPYPSPTRTWHTSTYPSISPSLPQLSLAGKTVLITGGSAGIGLSISKSVAQASAKNLIIFGRRAAVLDSAVSEITSQLGNLTKVFPIIADVSKKEDVDTAFSKIATMLPDVKLDILVLNAGYFSGLRPLGTETVSEWQTAFSVNVLSLYLITMAFLPIAKKDATIINISTGVAHLSSFLGFSSYGSTKMAGSKFLTYVEDENPDLRVVQLHPGQVTETEMAGKLKQTKGNENLDVHIDDGEY